jgi:mannose-6-phosphate isomerase-like protein (cupin superfamily)
VPTEPEPRKISAHDIRTAQVVVRCRDLPATLEGLTALGFAIDLVMPADAPTRATVSGYGVTLSLEQAGDREPAADSNDPVTLRLLCHNEIPCDAGVTRDIDGLRIEFAPASPAIELPEPRTQFVLTHAGDQPWHVGRAGMLYRDLIPGRLGGRFIASHIRIEHAGEVPDYVHYHRIRFQAIYCRSGRARLVYEDQGEPFLFSAGDCVLQPPEIRHRVLEASAGFEVIEIGCPAVHETHADRRLALPTGRTLPERRYGAQRFVRHIASVASWAPWREAQAPGFEVRDTGISVATERLASVRVVRSTQAGASTATLSHAGEFLFYFVLHGELALHSQALGEHELSAMDACVIPAGADFGLTVSDRFELLEVALPAHNRADTRPERSVIGEMKV